MLLRRSIEEGSDLENDLVQLRFDLLNLFGHMDKEVVIDIADGRHRCDTQRCEKCELLKSIPIHVAHIAAMICLDGHLLKISVADWACVFPGVEFGATANSRRDAVLGFFANWEDEMGRYVEHLFLKADRIRELELDVVKLCSEPSTELWFSDYMMSVKLVGTIDETEADFLSKDTANNLGFMRLYWADGQLWREYWDFVFEGAKDIQATIQIQKQFLTQVQSDRDKQGLDPVTCVKIWADNATDFKGGDAWDQWQKELKFADDNVDQENPLVRIVFNYHAEGEGKTKLDAHFGHLTTLRRRRERMKLERRTVKDLLISMLDAEATHVVHVELNREEEGRFYKTAKNVKRFHQMEVTKDTLKGKKTSRSDVEIVVLGDVKERKTKRSLAQRAKKQPKSHASFVIECQKCHNQLKKGELIEEWIQCEICDRSWHKTCVGYAADTEISDIKWGKCGECGGADPEGEMLQKRRKVACCAVCGKRRKGFDHSHCKAQRVEEAATFRTPSAVVIEAGQHEIGRKEEIPSKQKRKLRKVKKRRRNRGHIMSELRFHQLLDNI